MQYIIYNDPKYDGIGEYPYFKNYLGDNNDLILNTKFNIQLDDKTLYISYLDDNYDLSYLTDFIINLYDIKIFTMYELQQYIESNTKYVFHIVDNGDGSQSIAITDPAPFNDLTDHKNKNVQPFNGWIWNNDLQHWCPPIPKPNLNLNFYIGWNNEDICWNINFERTATEKKNKGYQLWLAADPDGSSELRDACSTRQYMIKPAENITHSTRNIENLIFEYSSRINTDSDNVRKYASINFHEVILDLSPIAIITYSECNDNATELFNTLYGIHPQFFSRSIHELFRLIIEWAYSYTHLSNTEPMAETCDRILKVLQMPRDVRNELLEIRPQQVGKFLLGQTNALEEYDEHIECPSKFSKWINKMYNLFTHVQNDENIHVDYIPESYEM